MNITCTNILLLAFCISSVFCEPSYTEGSSNTASHHNTLLTDIDSDTQNSDVPDGSNYDKRVERYAFGLGRRAYTYTGNAGNGNGNGIKRLPVYNFGLGKRARPYSFGLGKRSDYDADLYENELEHNGYNGYNAAYLNEKRNRPYSFGLGKREPMDDIDRRGYPNRYGFGLGRR